MPDNMISVAALSAAIFDEMYQVLSRYSVIQLKSMCKSRNITQCYNKKKNELIELLVQNSKNNILSSKNKTCYSI